MMSGILILVDFFVFNMFVGLSLSIATLHIEFLLILLVLVLVLLKYICAVVFCC